LAQSQERLDLVGRVHLAGLEKIAQAKVNVARLQQLRWGAEGDN
jgi:hypothetical protein